MRAQTRRMVTWLGATSLLVGGWLGVAWATSSPTKPRWLADRGGNAVVLVGGGHGEIGRFPVTRPVRVAVEPGGDRGVVASAVADYALGDHEVFWCEPDGTRLVTWATPAVRDLDVARGVAAWVTIGVAEPACLCLGRPGGGQSARGLSRLPTAQSPRSLAFDAAGEHLLVGCEGGRLELWSVGSLTRVNELVDPGAQWDDVVPAARGGWFALDANGGRVVRLDQNLTTS